MSRAARAAGFELRVQSGYRDFARQLAIWNGKFNGDRPMYDASGEAIQAAGLTPRERIDAILLWSALPGASRHHWGTDVDLIDANATPLGYQVQLTAQEFAAGGPYERLGQWLNSHAFRYGFFRPYQGVRSAVQAEPWHFSFAPVAEEARRALDVGVLGHTIEAAALQGKNEVLEQIDGLHARYVARVDFP